MNVRDGHRPTANTLTLLTHTALLLLSDNTDHLIHLYDLYSAPATFCDQWWIEGRRLGQLPRAPREGDTKEGRAKKHSLNK